MLRPTFFAARLTNKNIVRVRGPDTFSYIQTLITNDVRHLLGGENGPQSCIYAFMLNTMGRCLTDMFVYRTNRDSEICFRNVVLAPYFTQEFGKGGRDSDELLIECHKSMARPLAGALFAHKIRRNLTVDLVNDMDLWALYAKDTSEEATSPIMEAQSSDVTLVRDPRLPHLGYKFLTRLNVKTLEDLRANLPSDVELQSASVSDYDRHRYRHGVGEGPFELPEHHAFPLQANAVLLNAISFRKGLFTGNDITARNHRKGPVRRLMPIRFALGDDGDESRLLQEIQPHSELCLMEQDTTVVGEVICRNGAHGLAYIASKFLRDASYLQLSHPSSRLAVSAWAPFWWRNAIVPASARIPVGRHEVFLPANDYPPSNLFPQ